ncbi:MAG: hypothetical protein ACKOY8_08630 [Verrucomicrobiota bacterium]
MNESDDMRELDDLALDVLHGMSDDSGRTALAELLRRSPKHRRRMADHAALHAMLCQEGLAGALGNDPHAFFRRIVEQRAASPWRRGAWLAAAAVAAAVMTVTFLLRPSDAMASLEQIALAAEKPLSRTYAVRVLEPGRPEDASEGRGAYPPNSHLEGATLWIRGRGDFLLRQGLPNGEIRMFGGDRTGSWMMRGSGPVRVSTDPARFGRTLFAPTGDVAFLEVRDRLDSIRRRYRVEWIDRDSPDVRKLRALREDSDLGGPKEVEIWYDPADGSIERLILRQMPRGNGGPRSIELLLQSEEPLSDDFFRHESHHEAGRPVISEP